MGNLCTGEKVISLFVDDGEENEIEKRGHGIGFSKIVFKTKEWKAFKKFSNKKEIRQYHHNLLYKRFLSHPEVYIRGFRVRTIDSKDIFLKRTHIYKEVADVFFPTIFLKEHKGLEAPHSDEEISFARFAIMAYTFCAQNITDLISDFFACLRQRLTVHMKATIFSFNFGEVIKALNEETASSFAAKWCIMHSNPKNDDEISIEQIIKIGVKYPIIFYQLVRFRNHYRRQIYGDKFWENRDEKPRIAIRGLPKNYEQGFLNEKAAIRATAKAIISDITVTEKGNPKALSEISHEPIQEIGDECCYRLKHWYGYKSAMGIILESEISCSSHNQPFLDIINTYDNANEDVRIYDKTVNKEFIYNAGTGLRSWVVKYIETETDNVFKEAVWRYSHRELP